MIRPNRSEAYGAIQPHQIPDEVVEAAARALWQAQHEHWMMYKDKVREIGLLPPYDELTASKKKELVDEARATIAAALNAWPGAVIPYGPRLILPLPQEK